MPKHNTPPKQKSPRKLIILLSVVLALIIIATTYILMVPDNIFSKYISQQNTTPNTSNTTQPETPKPTTPTTPEPPKDTTNYLTLDDWGIKFTIPEGLEGVKYYKVQDWGYEFTTQRVEDIGGKNSDICVAPNDSGRKAQTLASIGRGREKAPEYSVPNHPLIEESIDGYYYYYDGGHSVCSSTGIDVQEADKQLLIKMFKTIEPIK